MPDAISKGDMVIILGVRDPVEVKGITRQGAIEYLDRDQKFAYAQPEICRVHRKKGEATTC